MESDFNISVFTLVIVGWVFSLCLHEFSHALVAYYGGDKTVKDKGYLTFNPLVYTHPFLSIILPLIFLMLGGIGLPGGAVYIDTSRLRSRHWDCAVSLAGPLSNVLLLLLLIMPFHLGFGAGRDAHVLWAGYAFLCQLQIMAVLFNLLPVPPLDGFQAIASYLKPRTRQWISANGSLFLLGLIVLLWRTPVGPYFWFVVNTVSKSLGIPPDLVVEGLLMTRLPFSL